MKICAKKVSGRVKIPSSKSFGHRLLIAASLGRESSRIQDICLSDDIQYSLKALAALGAKIQKEEGDYLLSAGKRKGGESLDIPCGESASTLRFFLPLALLVEGSYAFFGKGKLSTRPLEPYFPIFEKSGISYEKKDVEGEEGKLCLEVRGKLQAGDYQIVGDVSSQFITGLLFALPLLEGDSSLEILGKFESKAYVELTLEVLKDFGIKIQEKEKGFYIPGGQKYQARTLAVEGDYSQAAFFLVAKSLGQEIEVLGLKEDSLQGDACIVDYLKALEEKKAEETLVLDGSQCPDIIPVLALRAALTPGKTRLTNLSRLRIKECDRLAATAEVLNRLGAKAYEGEDFLELEGVSQLQGGSVSTYGDHRMAMMLAMAATMATSFVEIDNPDCVSKSYPQFWEDFKALGGEYVGK